VIFDRAIEPVRLSESSRWRFNAEQNILRENVIIAGNSTVLLPLTNDAFDMNRNREPLTVSFIDKNGTADYVVRRGGSMIRKVQEDPDCDCNISVNILQEHKILEAGAERYAFCYEVTPPAGRCDMEMELIFYLRLPIGNIDPTADNNYDPADTKCSGELQYQIDFYMELNDLGNNNILTITLERQYAHGISVKFWADCDDNGSYETQVGEHGFMFSESFDCKLPEFFVEPIVLYGDEAAEFIEGWVDAFDIPMAGESVRGDLYCFGIDRINYNFLLDDLIAHKCDLFIVTGAYDPTKQGIDGNMSTKQMVLDYKYTGGTYGYGESSVGGGQAVMNVLVIDKKPWGGLYQDFMPDDLELIEWLDNDWNSTLLISQEEYNPDPKKRYYKHDWCGEEIAINLLNLTDILTTSEKEIKEIKVRITDNTPDPVDGYHGNWRRSADVLKQLKSTPTEVKARFVGNNPYDQDSNWKIVKFDDSSITDNSKETTFIYNRAEDGLADGEVQLDYYILLDTNDHIKPVDSILVEFSSSETKFPNGCEETVTLEALPSTGSEIPGGMTRLDEIFQPTSNCPKYYYTKLIISDSQTTSLQSKTLYVSSRDHLLSGYDILDYTTSQADDVPDWGELDYFSFGTYRGQGQSSPNSEEKQWYSYDEFITNGGMEIVYAEVSSSDFTIPTADEDYQYVPVQSESDIIIINAHGGHENNNSFPPGAVTSDYFFTQKYIFPQNIYDSSVKSSQWRDNADEFDVNNIDSYYCDGIFTNYHCSDFSNEADAGWGDFWLKENGELRWLVVDACDSVKKTPTPQHLPDTFDLRDNWVSIINSNYISSVCGFRWHIIGSKHFLKVYGDYLNILYKQVGGYESLEEVCIPGHEYYYMLNNDDDWRWNASKDLSVAAWMEASAWGFNNFYAGRIRYRREWADRGICFASAINDEFQPGGFCYFYLKPIRSKKQMSMNPEAPKSHYCKHKIVKEYFH